VKYVVAFVFCACVFAQSQSQPFSCPSGTEDMLNYFVMAYPARVDENMGPGNANPIYSSVVPDYGNNTYAANGYFVWTKSLSGYPWDIKTYDTKFVYILLPDAQKFFSRPAVMPSVSAAAEACSADFQRIDAQPSGEMTE